MQRYTHGRAIAFSAILLLVLSTVVSVGFAQQEANGVEQTSPMQPQSVLVGKTVEPDQVQPGHPLVYTVVFTNTGEAVTLDTITDVLPEPFEYVGLAMGSEITQEPTDHEAPTIAWNGAFTVPAYDELMLRYTAWVPASTAIRPIPYTNVATASYNETSVGPAYADVEVVESDFAVSKMVTPAAVAAGETATYTVTFTNQGDSTAEVTVISDTLPAGFTFLDMASGSDITEAPAATPEAIVWSGAFPLPAGGTLKLAYQVATAFQGGERFPANSVEAVIDGEIVGPASAPVEMLQHSVFLPLVTHDFTPPQFTATKDVEPTVTAEGEPVIYTVSLVNIGDLPGVLATIRDTLPAGFTFQSMVAGSDVTTPPSGTTGTIVWNGPFTVNPHSELKLIYQVRVANTGGTYINSVTATASVGSPPQAPATAAVTVGAFFSDDFEDGIDNWTPYTNLRRLNEDMWFWDLGVGYGGGHAYTHNALAGTNDPDDYAHDALTMMLDEEAEGWTDYRYSVRFNLLKGNQAGVWFRGTYRDSDNPGQWVTGYYCTVVVRREGIDEMKLLQLRTEEEPGEETWPPYWYHVTNPLELLEVDLDTSVEREEWHQISVEVQGPRIKCYVDDELAIDFVDDEGSIFLNGTIGLYTYGRPHNNNGAVVRFDDVEVEPLR